ncbi:MAG: hypothetical protein QNK37_34630 [Acidobacteriota bacterium]|nr:hypothetical protein [Acidobacteriota bacterium]
MKSKFMLLVAMTGLLTFGLSQFSMAIPQSYCVAQCGENNPNARLLCRQLYQQGKCSWHDAVYNCCNI